MPGFPKRDARLCPAFVFASIVRPKKTMNRPFAAVIIAAAARTVNCGNKVNQGRSNGINISYYTLRARRAILLAVIIMIYGCTITPERRAWPSDLPPRDYYEFLYAEDLGNQEHQSLQEYLKWIKAFYRGWGGLRGWDSIREQILTDVDAAEREAMRRKLDKLGRRISGEWAKANGQRVIDSKTLQVWVNAAYKAGERRDYQQLLVKVTADVEGLLTGALDPSIITLHRYYPDTEPSPVGAGSYEKVPAQPSIYE